MSTASDEVLPCYRQTFAEIDLDAYGRNLSALANRLPAGSKLMPVLKANGYGHGAVELARCAQSRRVSMLAVALLEEALQIRRSGVRTPILILGTLTSDQVAIAVEEGFSLGITGPESLKTLVDHGMRRHGDQIARVHLKLDSGMNRMGFIDADLAGAAAELMANPWISVEGIYTHFANASDTRDPFTMEQAGKFRRMVETLGEAGITAPVHHSANSAAVMRGLIEPGDYVRVGITLLGGEPLDEGDSRLEPVLTWRTQIVRLKEVPAGSGIGYGTTFHTRRPSRIATLPVGYADGYNRLLSNVGEVLVHGTRAPVVGRVSMDLVTVDVTDVPLAAAGDPVVLLGSQGNERITAEEIAAKIGTIPYEVFCMISERVPRIYRFGSEIGIESKFGPVVQPDGA